VAGANHAQPRTERAPAPGKPCVADVMRRGRSRCLQTRERSSAPAGPPFASGSGHSDAVRTPTGTRSTRKDDCSRERRAVAALPKVLRSAQNIGDGGVGELARTAQQVSNRGGPRPRVVHPCNDDASTMDTAIIFALIALAGSALTTLATAFSAPLQSRRESQTSLASYQEPLLAAAYELQARLHDILCKRFMETYVVDHSAGKKETPVTSTLTVASRGSDMFQVATTRFVHQSAYCPLMQDGTSER
jgi:hypothetical protein